MFRRSKKMITSDTAQGPDGKRAYAIGDIHGRLDLLNELLDEIEADNARRSAKKTSIIFLGDLIDRGPDSRGVIERLLLRPPDFADCYFVLGNHEDALVRGLNGETRLLTSWLRYGGLECAQSYGIDIGTIHGKEPDIVEHALISAIPSSHIDFLKGFHESIRFGDYLFVHAGLRPNVPLEQQSARDMRWIRTEFLESDADYGCVVVHGHSVTNAVTIKKNRIGLDTGAYATGVLTALMIDGPDTALLQTAGSPDPIYSVNKDANNAVFTENGL